MSYDDKYYVENKAGKMCGEGGVLLYVMDWGKASLRWHLCEDLKEICAYLGKCHRWRENTRKYPEVGPDCLPSLSGYVLQWVETPRLSPCPTFPGVPVSYGWQRPPSQDRGHLVLASGFIYQVAGLGRHYHRRGPAPFEGWNDSLSFSEWATFSLGEGDYWWYILILLNTVVDYQAMCVSDPFTHPWLLTHCSSIHKPHSHPKTSPTVAPTHS